MNRKYKKLTGLELIKVFCSVILAYGIRNRLDLDGVKIWVSPKIAEALELDIFLPVEYQKHIYELPVIIKKSIKEVPLGNGQFQTDIYVGNPEWKIDINKGELWFES